MLGSNSSTLVQAKDVIECGEQLGGFIKDDYRDVA